MSVVISAFGLGKSFEKFAATFPEADDGALGGAANEPLELGEDLFDRIEVRAVGRQIQDLGSDPFDRRLNARHFVRLEVDHHDDVVRLERRYEMLFDVNAEEF